VASESPDDFRFAQRALPTPNEIEPGSMLDISITPIDWSMDTQEMRLHDHWVNLDDVRLPNLAQFRAEAYTPSVVSALQ
jgi:hypothetical protein